MNDNKMSEIEVSIRLAIFLTKNQIADSQIEVAIDGAQVRIGDKTNFDVIAFMALNGWYQNPETDRWQGIYHHNDFLNSINIHSQTGVGDVTALLTSGQRFVAESKKGSLSRSKSSSEYPLIREAIGQLMTIASIPENPFLAIAVPAGERFLELASRWRNAPLIRQSGIHILTVAPCGNVEGW